MGDYLVRAMAASNSIRVFGAYSRDTVEEARRRHDLSPIAAAALGRLLTGGAMMGAMLKNEDDLVTLQIVGDGPIGNMMVTGDNRGHVKGFVGNGSVMLPPNANHKLDVGGAVGRGVLTVIRDMGLKEPYAGQVELQTGEIAEDLTYYFATSEQTPSCVGLGVLINREDATVQQAGGFIVQLMPFASDQVIEKLEDNIRNIASVTTLLESGMSIEDILERLLAGMDMEITDRQELSFDCNCSRERIEKALISIGTKELQSMIDEGETIVMNCHFCNTDYAFSVDELEKIKDKLT